MRRIWTPNDSQKTAATNGWSHQKNMPADCVNTPVLPPPGTKGCLEWNGTTLFLFNTIRWGCTNSDVKWYKRNRNFANKTTMCSRPHALQPALKGMPYHKINPQMQRKTTIFSDEIRLPAWFKTAWLGTTQKDHLFSFQMICHNYDLECPASRQRYL